MFVFVVSELRRIIFKSVPNPINDLHTTARYIYLKYITKPFTTLIAGGFNGIQTIAFIPILEVNCLDLHSQVIINIKGLNKNTKNIMHINNSLIFAVNKITLFSFTNMNMTSKQLH